MGTFLRRLRLSLFVFITIVHYFTFHFEGKIMKTNLSSIVLLKASVLDKHDLFKSKTSRNSYENNNCDNAVQDINIY